jgi:hypothetical protein
MNKKILFISVLSVFMLLAIAFASTVTSDTQKPPKKESPLFGIRVRQAIKEKISDFITRFVGERVFFLPFTMLKSILQEIQEYTHFFSNCPAATCEGTRCNGVCTSQKYCTYAQYCTSYCPLEN